MKRPSITNLVARLGAWLAMPESDTSHTTAPETESKDDSLSIEREHVENTPFIIVGTKKHGYWLTMGEHRLTPIHKTKKEVIKVMNEKSWTLISAVMIAFIHGRAHVDKAFTKDLAVPPSEKAETTAKTAHL